MVFVPTSQLARPMRLSFLIWLLLALLASLFTRPVALPLPAPLPPIAPAQQSLVFSPNAGQLDPAIRFQARALGGTLFFTDHEIMLALPTADQRAAPVVRLQFVGAQTATVEAEQRLPGVINVFSGADPTRWRSNVPTYAALHYRALYPGIDLRYEDAGQADSVRLKGTYTVAPGGDPARIRWRYVGAQSLRIDPQTGALQISLPGSAGRAISEAAPVAWQVREGRRRPVAVQYDVAADGIVGFALGRYDQRLPLTIDPTLDYSSYLGGSFNDAAYAIAVDAQGNTYLTGRTSSSDFPTAQPLQPTLPSDDCLGDVFVTKWSAGGLVYSTYLGGDDCERGEGIVVDATGSVYLTGTTSSEDFPTSHAFQPDFASSGCTCPDTFFAKLSPDGGTLIYSSYFGGDDQDTASAIAVDAAGSVYLTGTTVSNDFPTQQPLQDTRLGYGGEPFVAKLSPDGRTLIYSTYLGGSEFEISEDLAVDRNGQVIVVGFTGSSDFPTTAQAFQRNGSRDAFVSKLSADGQALIYSTYLGGSRDDQARAVAIDAAGNAYLTGFTQSLDFPTQGTLQPASGASNAFVTKLSADGSTLRYSTYLGGSDDAYGLFTDYEQETGSAIAVDRGGSAYVVGSTNAQTFPTVRAIQSTLGGPNDCGEEDFIACADAFVVKLNPAGNALVYSSYLGGSAEDLGSAVAVDERGRAYLAGQTGSTNFPSVGSRYPSREQDAFVASISTPGDLVPTLPHQRFVPLLFRPSS